MRHLVVRDLSACPVDAAQTIVWRAPVARGLYLTSQMARHKANADDLLARAIYSICLSLERTGGEPITAGECWNDYRTDLRRESEAPSWDRSLSFTMAWTAVRFMSRYGSQPTQQVISRSSVPDGIMVSLRARSLAEPASWSDALQQVVTSTVVALLETPDGEGRITKNSVFKACLLAIREDDTPSGDHIRRVVARYLDAIWEELAPAT